ncbi:MAG: 16S rRNA (cytosine(967)-C(5))-methyltransferase RsmB [Deltaproteobacteria bacterium]|nr:16S rRNA (cytosine(967)-C(5))-methyltransferase RsmB [Deltaproteobacteria bacterium]
MRPKDPRSLALRALNRPDARPGATESALERLFDREPGLSARDRAFVVHLAQGVLRWRLRLDWVIGQSLKIPFRKVEPDVLNILRLAVYQVLFLDRVPDRAAVNEAVRQANGLGRGRHLGSFVNGVLRNICRNKDTLSLPEGDAIQVLSVKHAYPRWLVRKWVRELGEAEAERLMEAGNRIPRLVVRANILKVDRAGLLRRLARDGLECSPGSVCPDAVEISGLKGPVQGVAAFREGLFQVQDEAAQLCTHLLAPAPGERVLDLCAGLGGKTTHMAALMRNRGRITALDISQPRLVTLAENCTRLGVRCVDAVQADAARGISRLLQGSFDRVLVDGPCSSLGVISRHPDAKWARDEAEIARLSGVQKRLLHGAWEVVRKGGRLLYAACTISRPENEEVVEAFLASHPDMALLDLRREAPAWARQLVDDRGFLRTFPHRHGMDGFFAALFTRKKK